MIADTQIAGTELLAASAQLQSALASARARLVRVARLTLVASILPVTVFIGWLAATEPSIMIGSALVLALWIGCDHGQEGALAAKSSVPAICVSAIIDAPVGPGRATNKQASCRHGTVGARPAICGDLR